MPTCSGRHDRCRRTEVAPAQSLADARENDKKERETVPAGGRVSVTRSGSSR